MYFFFSVYRMFFTLHANVCGTSIPHHGHSHGGGGHGHSHGGGGHRNSRAGDHGCSQGGDHGHSSGGDHGHSHGGDHGHSHDDNHDHGHDDSHDNTDTIINADPIIADIATQPTQNLNVRAAIIHVIGDFVQSVGVLCAAILIHFKVQLQITKSKRI
jgi:Co/Zn/Cd efflux system component